jgi:acyl-CoA dehydrogenase
MISFELSDEQKMVRETVAAFAANEIRPAARAADEAGSIPRELIAKAWELGVVLGALPGELGGYGEERSAVTGVLVAEELACGDLAIALDALAARLFAYPVLEMGTEAQRAKFLRPAADHARLIATAAMMEPSFDFDPAAMRTIARHDGGGFVVNGSKCCVPFAADAQSFLIYAASDAARGFSGVDAFILAQDTPGLDISSRERNMGLKGLATCELTLADCRLDADARLGGAGGINFVRLVSESRVAMAAMAVGVARAAFEYACVYAKERKAFGVPIATKQAVAFMLAEMAIEIDASRLLVWEAASHLDKGEDALKESYQARNYSAQSSLIVTDNAVQVLGGHGYIREHPVEMWLRNARAFGVIEGLAIV